MRVKWYLGEISGEPSTSWSKGTPKGTGSCRIWTHSTVTLVFKQVQCLVKKSPIYQISWEPINIICGHFAQFNNECLYNTVVTKSNVFLTISICVLCVAAVKDAVHKPLNAEKLFSLFLICVCQ